jgi:hypothetical protein
VNLLEKSYKESNDLEQAFLEALSGDRRIIFNSYAFFT